MMSDFMERARAEAERRWGYFINQHGWDNVQQACNFMEGAAWALDVLLADPTDGEVGVAAEAVKDRLSWASLHWGVEGVHPDALPHIARAAIAAFLSARRGSE